MTMYEVFRLLGGVGLFLYGMSVMSNGLRKAAGDKMREILERLTSNKLMAVLMGILVTVLIQSSSATDMMVIGFVNSGLMNLTQAIAVIMGANIGTTVTAQITAFNLTEWTPLLLFIGCVMSIFFRKSLIRHIGTIILGFGMLFVGIWMIRISIQPLSESEGFVHVLSNLSNPALAVLFGLAFTALLQSSSSSIVIFQAFAVQGLLDYHTCVYLVIGAAIGSVTPNILAGMTTNRDGKRTAILNLIFNLFRAFLLLVLITIFPQLLTLIRNLSPGDIGRQVANTHTIFAVFAVICGFPLMTLFVALAKKVLPDLPEELEMKEEKQLVYMQSPDTVIPTMVVRQAMMETIRMGRMARDNLEDSLTYFFDEDEKLLAKVLRVESVIDYLTNEISDRLIDLRTRNLSSRDVFRVSKLLLILSNFERISDHAENVTEYAQKLGNSHETISEEGLAELKEMARLVMVAIDTCIEIFSKENFTRLDEAWDKEQAVDDYNREIINHHADRLAENRCMPMAGIVFVDLCTDLERCADHAINIANALVSE